MAAARTLAMTAASAPAARLWSSHRVESNSESSIGCKDFGGAGWSTVGVVGLRMSGVPRRDVVIFAGKKNTGPSGSGRRPRSGMQARRKPKSRIVEDDDDDDAAMEKALEALFAQLEMDLNSEGDGGDDDDDEAEFTDEELTQMTKELEAAFNDMDLEGLAGEDMEEEEDSGLVDMVMTDGVYSQDSGVAKDDIQKSRKQQDEDDDDEEEDFEEEEDDEDEQRMVPLEKWQLRKLAAAVEQGRRNVNVSVFIALISWDIVCMNF